MIQRLIPIVATIGQGFDTGRKVAQAVASLCVMGAMATGALLTQLTGLSSDEHAIEVGTSEDEESEGDEPP